MGKLKYEKTVMIKVDYDDLEEFIKEEFNQHGYNFIADEELSNDSTWTANVEPKEMNLKELISFIRTGNAYYKTRSLLNQLCFEGKIDAGEYVVDISY